MFLFYLVRKTSSARLIITYTMMLRFTQNVHVLFCKVTFSSVFCFQSNRLDELSLSDIILDPDGNIAYYWLVRVALNVSRCSKPIVLSCTVLLHMCVCHNNGRVIVLLNKHVPFIDTVLTIINVIVIIVVAS